MVVFKRAAKEIDINCRHSGALTGHDRQTRRMLLRILQYLRDQLALHHGNQPARKRLWRMTRSCVRKLLSIISIPQLIFVTYNGDRLRIDSEVIQEAMIPITYRFKNRLQLWELHNNLQIPQWFTIPLGGHRIHGQEMLLMALERCALGTRLINMQQKYHIYHSVIGKALHYFALWMQDNWGYLIHDNTEFWLPYLRPSCEAIRTKLLDHYDVEVDEIGDDEDGFLIAQFIDCIIIPSSRTGGGGHDTWEIRCAVPLPCARGFI